MAAYLEKKVGGLSLDIFKSRKYTYDLYLMYKTQKERRAYLRRLEDITGIKPVNGGVL